MHSFLGNLCLRPSCYECHARSGSSGADITIADFWGIENLNLGIDFKKGCSAVIVHSDIGRQFWEKILRQINLVSVELKDILISNPCYSESVKRPKGRDYFMQRFRTQKIKHLAFRALHGPWIIYQLSRVIRKVCSLGYRTVRR